ncbi:MAG: DUF6717 family protein [Ferruginibacter sp.]
MKAYTFNKNETGWFVDLPDYVAQGGKAENLQMMEGADVMLDIIAAGNNTVSLIMAIENFENSYALILKEKCDVVKGGGFYVLEQFEEKKLNLHLWLCDVTEYVFGDIPEIIFLRKEQ